MDVVARKAQIRKDWKACFPKDPAVRARASLAICKHLVDQPAFQVARTIAIYAGRPSEIDVFPLFQIFPRRYAFPKVDVARKTMEFYEVLDPKVLTPGVLNILTPQENDPVPKWGKCDLVIVPGSAFDRTGHRIGSGGGFYDRFFERFPDVQKWGIAYETQLLDEPLAGKPHDVRMGAICTERGFFECREE